MKIYEINVDKFLSFEPESCYILGLMWADATLKSGKNSIILTGITDDLESTRPLFEKYGTWGFYYRDNWSDNIQRKEQLSIYTSNKILYNFLELNGYLDKNLPLILDKIPNENLKYWWRGYVDGDGCFYVNFEQRHKDFFFTSYYNQDWSFVQNLFNSLNIEYKIVNSKSQKSSCSRIIIKKDENVIKFGDYIYEEYEKDNIGYFRKYEKFLSIKKWKINKFLKTENVYKNGNKWQGTFNFNYKTYYCGTFENKQDAIESVLLKKYEVIPNLQKIIYLD